MDKIKIEDLLNNPNVRIHITKAPKKDTRITPNKQESLTIYQKFEKIFQTHTGLVPQELIKINVKKIFNTLIVKREKTLNYYVQHYLLKKEEIEKIEDELISDIFLSLANIESSFEIICFNAQTANSKVLKCWAFFEDVDFFISNLKIKDSEKNILKGFFLTEFARVLFPIPENKKAYFEHKNIVDKYSQYWVEYETIWTPPPGGDTYIDCPVNYMIKEEKTKEDTLMGYIALLGLIIFILLLIIIRMS
jgi:hypothetical protein